MLKDNRMAPDVDETTPATKIAPTEAELRVREARRRQAQTGEAESGLWQRVHFGRAITEGTAIYAAWRLLVLLSPGIWPPALFPFVLLGLLLVRFLPPVWASLRLIATKREKMSRRFFKLAGMLATTCLAVDILISLAVGDPAQPFGGPTFGPDLPRFFGHAHHLGFGAFLVGELATYGLLLAYYLIATICTRLAQGGFLRFTM